VCRSRQTLDLAKIECESWLTQSRLIEPLLPRAARCIGALNNTLVALAWAVRPLAAGEPEQHANLSCSICSGCPSFGGQRATGSARRKTVRCTRSNAESSWKRSLNTKDKQPGVVQSCHACASRWPCGVPQRRAAGAVQASASPMPVASARLATTTPNAKYKWALPCLRWRGLTLRSSGHTTAGHSCALRLHRRRRRVPLTSNVRPRVNRMRHVAPTTEVHRTAAAEGNSSRRFVEQHTRCVGVGRPSVEGRRAVSSCHGFLQHQRGLSVLWRPAHRRFGSSSTHRPNGGVCSSAVPSLKQSKKVRATQAGVRSVSPRSCVSLLPRGAGASAHAVQSQPMVLAIVVPSSVRSNPSVKRTHNGGARLLALPRTAAPSCAAYLKR